MRTFSVVLIGYRGSGKTTVGRLLAERMGRGFVDSDERIIARAGKSIRKIFEEHGEAGFRDIETQVVQEIAAMENHVIALGGGALGREVNLAAIQSGKHRIIYLRCEPKILLRRIRGDPATAQARPALSKLGGGIEEIRSILAQREPMWKKAMHYEVDVTKRTPEQVADYIAALSKG
jgi:shikimate kinase